MDEESEIGSFSVLRERIIRMERSVFQNGPYALYRIVSEDVVRAKRTDSYQFTTLIL